MEIKEFITNNHPNYERAALIEKTVAFQLITENHPSSFIDDNDNFVEQSAENVEITIEQAAEHEIDDEMRSFIEEIEKRFPQLRTKPARMSATLDHCGAVCWLGISVGSGSTLDYWWRVDEFQEIDLTSGPMWN